MQQLKLWQQREKEWARSRAKREKSNKRSIYFSDSVMLLEAAARNDIDEGKVSNLTNIIQPKVYVRFLLCYAKTTERILYEILHRDYLSQPGVTRRLGTIYLEKNQYTHKMRKVQQQPRNTAGLS